MIIVLAVLLIVTVHRARKVASALDDLLNNLGVGLRTTVSHSFSQGFSQYGPPRSVSLRPRELTGPELLRPRTYAEYRHEIDELIARAAVLGDFGPVTKLSRACELALVEGKRLRPIIAWEIARGVSLGRPDATPVDPAELALFVEYLHSASLVIDDLPAFDNDTLRRGRPTVHAVSGVGVAQMAAISIAAAAFQNLCRQLDWVRANCPEFGNIDRVGTRLCGDVSRALGALGAAGGQYMDAQTPEEIEREAGPDAAVEIALRKTASFFEIATLSGWLIAGGSPEFQPLMRELGSCIGLAYQIADDIGDLSTDMERGRGKNYAAVYGIDTAHLAVDTNLRIAKMILVTAGLWSPVWGEIFGGIRGSNA